MINREDGDYNDEPDITDVGDDLRKARREGMTCTALDHTYPAHFWPLPVPLGTRCLCGQRQWGIEKPVKKEKRP